MSFVLDGSMTLAWCFADEATPFSDGVLVRLSSSDAAAPAIWPLEVANVLLLAERRRRITQAQAEAFVRLLRTLAIAVDPGAPTAVWGAIMAVARRYQLTAYDAAYLELALREGLPMATLDARLRAAATAAGVPLVA
ncbi:MAG TPA: type II toxin-antitoxin system VapC family toxin [Bacillota bacterium]|nr:type II toxin-antitoxin system VapC family toxin [Bacillota bacterium]